MTAGNPADILLLLREYSQRHPRVDITLQSAEHGTAGLIEMLRTGELDVALVAASHDQGDLDVVPVARSPPRLTVPAGHPLTEAATVGLDALAGEKFIEFRDGYGVRTQTDAAFADAGIRRRVAFEVMDIAAFVDNGLGIAFLPDFVSVDLEHAAVVPLQVELADMVVSVATRKHRQLTAAAHAMRTLILEST